MLTLRRHRERALLAVLLLEPHRPVAVDRLTGLLWDGDPPPAARRTVHSHVARIRAALDAARAGRYGVRLVTTFLG